MIHCRIFEAQAHKLRAAAVNKHKSHYGPTTSYRGVCYPADEGRSDNQSSVGRTDTVKFDQHRPQLHPRPPDLLDNCSFPSLQESANLLLTEVDNHGNLTTSTIEQVIFSEQMRNLLRTSASNPVSGVHIDVCTGSLATDISTSQGGDLPGTLLDPLATRPFVPLVTDKIEPLVLDGPSPSLETTGPHEPASTYEQPIPQLTDSIELLAPSVTKDNLGSTVTDPSPGSVGKSFSSLERDHEVCLDSAVVEMNPIMSSTVGDGNGHSIKMNSNATGIIKMHSNDKIMSPDDPCECNAILNGCQPDNALKTGLDSVAVSIGKTQQCKPTVNPNILKNQTVNPKWTTLFKNKPRNAGRYTPKYLNNEGKADQILVPPQSVIDAGYDFWSHTLVGFFLDNGYPFSNVRSYLMNRWKNKGEFKIRYDNELYYIDFTCPIVRRSILEADPIVLGGKVFIVTAWSPSIDAARENVLSIPVWTKFSNIPSSLQPLDNLDWLASHIGRTICFDELTVRREKLEYAKALIEITPDHLLPSFLDIAFSDGRRV